MQCLGLDFKQVGKTTWPDEAWGGAIRIHEERAKVKGQRGQGEWERASEREREGLTTASRFH